MYKVKPMICENRQVIPIPDELRLPDEEIIVNRVGGMITLTPRSQLESVFEHGIQSFTDDFMADGRPEQTHEYPDVDFELNSGH